MGEVELTLSGGTMSGFFVKVLVEWLRSGMNEEEKKVLMEYFRGELIGHMKRYGMYMLEKEAKEMKLCIHGDYFENCPTFYICTGCTEQP